MTQLDLFGKSVTTVEGIKHICLLCKKRFVPLHETHFVCNTCQGVDECDSDAAHSTI
jgi:Fe2+ or Zn2+ uptake regulation protein